MTTPIAPKLLKGGIVLLDPTTGATLRTIALQYNPDTLTRTLQIQAAGEGGDRLEALRLKGPPHESIKLDAEIDATDQLEFPHLGRNKAAVKLGIHPQLAALEMLVHPTANSLRKANELAKSGTLEIASAEAPLTLFVWSRNRIVPVRLTEFSVTEDAFDTALNPIRAKVNLGMRVLSVNDMGSDHKGGSLFMSYLQNKEQLAVRSRNAPLSTLGITGIP